MRRQISAFLLALPLLLSTVGAQASLTISGVVTEKGTGNPVSGAEVSIVGGKANQDVTDSEGKFSLKFSSDVRPGTVVRIRVVKKGYETYTDSISVSSELSVPVSLRKITKTKSPSTSPNPPQLQGKLLPSDEPTPPNSCTNLAADRTLGLVGDGTLILMGFATSYVDRFPHTVLMVDDQPRLVVHKESDGAVWLSLDIFGADGKIIASLDEDGFTVRPGSYFKLTKKDKSSLRIVDEYNEEVLNVRYVNPHAIWLNALLRYPGSNRLTLKGSTGGGICTAHGGTAEINIKTKPDLPPNALAIHFSDDEPYKIIRAPYTNYQIGVFNNNSSPAENVSVTIHGIDPKPHDSILTGNFPYVLFTASGEQHVRINPHDEVLFSLASSWLSSEHRIIIDGLNHKIWQQPYASIAIQQNEEWNVTLQVTNANGPPIQVSLEVLPGYDSAWIFRPGTNHEASTVLLLDCEVHGLPVRFWPDSPLYVMETQTGGLAKYSINAKGTESLWPSADSSGEFAYQCEATNYSDDPIFGVNMTVGVAFQETHKDENGTWRGGPNITNSSDHRIVIPKLDGHGGKFVFYIWNNTAQFTMINLPLYAEAELAKTTKRARIHLKLPSNPVLMPLSPWNKLLK
jgi:CarboxypepD_reg-like domain